MSSSGMRGVSSLGLGLLRYSIAVVLLILHFSGLALGGIMEEKDVIPRGTVSITRGIVPRGIGDESCDYAGNIVLGGFFSLESDDKFSTIGNHQLKAYNMVVDQINRYQCGVTLKEMADDGEWIERNYALELRIYDDQSSTEGSSALAGMLSNDPSVDILVGGYSSTLTLPFAEIANNSSDKLFLAAGASSTKVYAGKDLAFGLLPPSNKYLSLAIEALAKKHGAKTLATVWEDASFTRIACGSAPDLAEEFGMTMTSATEVVKTPNATVLGPVAETLKEEDPDVVITCVYDCNPWVQAMRQANWNPKAQVFTICVGQEGFANEAGSDTEYMMGVTPWHPSLQVKDSVTGWSASEFASRYRTVSREEETADVPYQAAMAASLISMLHQAIEEMNGFRDNGHQLADHISKNSFATMGGKLEFDENGQLKAPSLTVQYDTNGVVQTVYPPELSSGDMLYPMPSWDRRDCINLSGCEGANGNLTFVTGNTCDDLGMCVCGDSSNFRSVGVGATANCIELEEMNYINDSFIVLSWVLTGIVLAFCLFCLGWTYYYRENSLVKISQPLFLAFVVVGSMLSILSVVPMGVEGSYREEDENIRAVDASCMAVPWLWGLGFAITYSALFAKVWRIHKLYNHSAKLRRKTVDYKDVFYIMIIVVALELGILISYQLVSPLMWQREVIEDIDGYSIESLGSCQSEQSWSWQCVLMTFNVLCLFIALVLCWRTKDLPSDFSESNYIFLSVMFMFQILLITIPVTTMVRDDPNVFFFIRMGGIVLQNVSVLMLIFVPKMRRIYLGEDTRASIKNAIAIDMSIRRDSMLRSDSLMAKSPSRRFSATKEDKSCDSMDLASTDSFDDMPSSFTASFSNFRNCSAIDISARTNKSNEETIDEEIAYIAKQDYKVQISREEQKQIDKQLSRVSWRSVASSGGSISS